MKVSFALWLTANVSLLFLLFTIPSWACECGEDFCIGGTRYEAAVLEKNSRLKNAGYMPNMIALLDKADACYAAISRAPDGFSIMTVSKDSIILVLEWSEDDIRIASENLSNGNLSRYFIFNSRQAYGCCGTNRAEERPDWNSELSLNTGQAIECTWNGAVACK